MAQNYYLPELKICPPSPQLAHELLFVGAWASHIRALASSV